MTTTRRLTLAVLLGVFAFGLMGCKIRARHFVRHGVQRTVNRDAAQKRQREVQWRNRVNKRHQALDRIGARTRTRTR